MKELTTKSLMAGVVIGIGGFAYMAVTGVWGAALFSFGLIAVYLFELKLFTGMAGRSAYTFKGQSQLFYALLMNFIGAAIVGMMARLSTLPVQQNACNVIAARLSTGAWQAGVLAVGCGFIVDEAVHSYRRTKKYLPTVIGITVFISCGMPHCVADAFFLGLAPLESYSEAIPQAIATYFSIVAGNYIGCNMRRWVLKVED